MTNQQTIKESINKAFKPISYKVETMNTYISPLISLIHITNPNNLPNITVEGLKIEKTVTPIGATEIIEISKKIKKELNKPQDRYKAIYAVFNNKDNEHFINWALELNTYSALEFKVNKYDPDIYVANVDWMNDSITYQTFYNKDKDEKTLHYMENALYEYWKSFVPLTEYINDELYYYQAEVLIFHDIESYELNILTK